MKTFSFFILFIAIHTLSLGQDASLFNSIEDSFKKNDAASISYHFAETLDLSIGSTDGTYGKQQAGVVLKEFLSKNKIVSFNIKHKGASNKRTQYSISEMKSTDKEWSVYVLINTNNKITQLQIEEE